MEQFDDEPFGRDFIAEEVDQFYGFAVTAFRFFRFCCYITYINDEFM